MRKCIYYVTMSVDGFIADSEHATGWMTGSPNVDYGFNDFYSSISTMVFGRKTYEHILRISGDKGYFPYEDKEIVVFSSNPDMRLFTDDSTIIDRERAEQVVARMKIDDKAGDIWVAGGAELATSLMKAGLLDELHVFIQPVVLGEGLSLFNAIKRPLPLKMEDSKMWSGGVAELRYHTVKSWRVDM
ncbi:MAG: dihydrofolate reductase [Coriobacteriia bacterium]|nr:dihydrofolate reductase [Coriobacteriia bacterium]